MYSRTITLYLGPNSREVAFAIADQSLPIYQAGNGFVSVTFVVADEDKGEYVGFSVWKTKADAEAIADKLRPWLIQNFGDKLAAPPTAWVGEVYEPKG